MFCAGRNINTNTDRVPISEMQMGNFFTPISHPMTVQTPVVRQVLSDQNLPDNPIFNTTRQQVHNLPIGYHGCRIRTISKASGEQVPHL